MIDMFYPDAYSLCHDKIKSYHEDVPNVYFFQKTIRKNGGAFDMRLNVKSALQPFII